MKKLVVFLDYDSNYYDRVEKIQNDTDTKVESIYIEDYLKDSKSCNIDPEDVIYFLTNVDEIKDVIKSLSNSIILNKKYYLDNCIKTEIQEKIKQAGVDTPDIIDYRSDFINNDFPLYLKNVNHDVFVAKICSKRSFKYLENKIDMNEFYLEREIKSVDIIKEHKIYYCNNSVYKNDLDTISDKIIDICNTVAKVTGLDVYSADLIETKDKVYVIDVNAAPGFWYSKESRLKLIEYCRG